MRPRYLGKIITTKEVTCARCERCLMGIRGASELVSLGWRKHDVREGWLCPDCALVEPVPSPALYGG